MKNMKRNMLLVPFVAVLALLVVGFASAGLANNVQIELNGESIDLDDNLASFAGDVVPVRVTFVAGEDAEDVKVEVGMYDGRDDVDASTGRFNVVAGKRYTKLLSLRLPSDIDEDLDEMTLSVEIYDADHDTDDYDEDYRVSMQRESYVFEVLSVDYTSKVSAGDVFPVSVVVKNVGFNRMDDAYVVASIPALGVSTRGYVGDLIPNEDYVDYDDEEDSMLRTVYLKVPAGTAAGVYELEVEVYNSDSETVVKNLISVGDSASTLVLASVKNKDLNAGDTITYDMVIVNSADDVRVFNIETVSGDVLSVSAPSVVTVGPDASETVSVTVTADSDADVGTYTFSVDVDGEQTVFSANVVGASVSTSIVALTVILVIIFVVLLAVLVVLLTRKEAPIEEVETSYY
ncbi:hypothetical protein HN935_03410 [archaeon]|jgi:hypothetical protein|nr:hypothetical protein [archaeon]